MSYDMLSSGSLSALRNGCDPFDLPSNNGLTTFNSNNFGVNGNNGAANTFPFKPLAMTYTQTPRPHLTMAEQAELEFELRYRGNMIVDQQRKIQQLEEELKRAREQIDMMNSQITTYEQERQKERKKPQSRYWTPEEHQRFLEALNKYGHKDVKAISMHVNTRNATQVRTHAQKYFLRLERERRKKGGEDDGTGYNSSGDELYSDQSMSPIEDYSPIPPSVMTPPPLAQPSTLSFQPRRRRSTSLITPSLGKQAIQHREAVLAEMPSWTLDDFDQFVKGLLTFADKQEDLTQVCRLIRETHVPHIPAEDVENCYRLLNKLLKQKPSVSVASPVISSPKRRRTNSKPEVPLNLPLMTDGPLPAMGTMSLGNSPNNGNFGSFAGMSLSSNGQLQFPGSSPNSNGNLLPFSSSLSGMNVRPSMLDYSGIPSMAPLNITNSLGGMGNMDSLQQSPTSWNSLSFTFDLHQNPPSLNLPQGAPLVSSLN